MPSIQTSQITAGPAAGKVALPELRALTGARFFAAAFVVLYHFGRPFLAGAPEPIIAIAGTGYAAVGFFFLLSGFVMAYSYITPEGQMRGAVHSFWAARAARIYPAYLLAFLIAAPFNVAGSLHANGASIATAKLLAGGAAVLSLMQAWTPWTAWYWNYPAWSLSSEVFFYLAFPLLVPMLGRLSRAKCLMLLPGVWLCGMAVPAYFSAVHSTVPSPTYSSAQLAIEVTPLLRLPEFVMGILLGRIFILGRTKTAILGAPWLAYVGIAGTAVLLSCSMQIPRPLIANGLAAPFSALTILGLAHGKGSLARFLSLPPLVLLGEASYGVYILQVPVGYVFGIDAALGNALRTVLFVVGLTGISIGFFKLCEQPIRPILRAKLLRFLDARNPAGKNESGFITSPALGGNV